MLYGDAWGHNLDCCNQTVLRNVISGLEIANVPIGWIQMDDWWYKGYMPIGGGVFCAHDWLPWPEVFPGGLDGIQTKVPWLLCVTFLSQLCMF